MLLHKPQKWADGGLCHREPAKADQERCANGQRATGKCGPSPATIRSPANPPGRRKRSSVRRRLPARRCQRSWPRSTPASSIGPRPRWVSCSTSGSRPPNRTSGLARSTRTSARSRLGSVRSSAASGSASLVPTGSTPRLSPVARRGVVAGHRPYVPLHLVRRLPAGGQVGMD